MNKTKICMAITIIAALLVSAQGISRAEPEQNSQPSQSITPAESVEPAQSDESTQAVQSTETARPAEAESGDIAVKYENLVKELDAVKKDRDNVLVQTKRLLEGKSKMIELEEMHSKWQKEKADLEAKSSVLETENSNMIKNIQQLQDAQTALKDTVDNLKTENESLQKGTEVGSLKNKIDELQKDKDMAVSEVKKEYEPLRKYVAESEKEIARLKKDKEEALKKKQAEIEKFKKDGEKAKFRIEELERFKAQEKKKSEEAMRKNKAMENELRNLPKKFAEVSRQNKMLLKETAQMHYNLGVFYTRGQEYERALTEFKKSVDIDNSNAAAYFNLGYIYAEYLVNRKKAIESFRHYLQYSKGNDKDADWVRKYLLTWDTYDGKDPIY
jgi:Chromosome segregation ATPases